MCVQLKAYIDRLHTRDIRTWMSPGPALDKFYPNGQVKPLYGLTCIAWIDRGSVLFKELCVLQNTLRERFEQDRLDDLYAFLEPESFHMTLCDIVASSDPIQSRDAENLIRRVRSAFEQMGKPGKVTCCVRGIGLTKTITALVRFCTKPGLNRVLDLERRIKHLTETNVRDFTGHISLAYLVRHPGERAEQIQEVVLPYEDRVFGQFTFTRFDLTHFTDMNTYKTLLTVDLEDGTVTEHQPFVLPVTISI